MNRKLTCDDMIRIYSACACKCLELKKEMKNPHSKNYLAFLKEEILKYFKLFLIYNKLSWNGDPKLEKNFIKELKIKIRNI